MLFDANVLTDSAGNGTENARLVGIRARCTRFHTITITFCTGSTTIDASSVASQSTASGSFEATGECVDFAVSDKEVFPGKDDMTFCAGMRFVFAVILGVPNQRVLRGICPATEVA